LFTRKLGKAALEAANYRGPAERRLLHYNNRC
jgi:hypothetical protein